MILAWTHFHSEEAPLAMEKAAAVLQGVIGGTVAATAAFEVGGKKVPPELRIIQSKPVFENPVVRTRCRLVTPLDIKGVVFDLDGTLTLPHQIDFDRIRERTSVPIGEDIVSCLRHRFADDAAGLASAMAIVDEEEKKAFDPPQLQPGLRSVILKLQDAGVKLGIFTRNSMGCVDALIKHADLPQSTFAPTITRDSNVAGKPDAAPVLHCCESWSISPSNVLVVGDMKDDWRSGRAAGACTVRMLGADTGAKLGCDDLQNVDFTITSLDSLERFFP